MKGKLITLAAVAIFLILGFPVLAMAEKTVIIDPGHGGRYTGTSGYSGASTGYYEKHANMEISQKLRAVLVNKGYNVKMTRTTDKHFSSYSSSADLRERMKVANGMVEDRDNTIFISIHHNALPSNPAMRGYETYYFDIKDGISSSYPPDPLQVKYSPESRRLAKVVHTNVLSYAPVTEGRGIVSNNLYVTRNAQVPSILAEMGYMSNPTEERNIKSSSDQQKKAEALARGIDSYFNVYEVYNESGERLRIYETEGAALTYAKSRDNVYVFDKARQEVTFTNIDTRYEVHHAAKGLLEEPFATEEMALDFAKKWKNTYILDNETDNILWSNYLSKNYSVIHAAKGELYSDYNLEGAIQYAEDWKNTKVVNTKTDELLWSNYLSKNYSVIHAAKGELYTAYSLNGAIEYAEDWLNTKVVNTNTGELLWSNYLDVDKENNQVTEKNFKVIHAAKGELYADSTLEGAIGYAEDWLNTKVVNEKTGELLWSNYLDVDKENNQVTEKNFKVIHAAKGELYADSTLEGAINYAKDWLNTKVVNEETGELLWSNYLDVDKQSNQVTEKNFKVIHAAKGELYADSTLEGAIDYAGAWLNTKVVNEETGELLWSNYLQPTYAVTHSVHGVLYESFSKDDAIEYAQKWKNTKVIHTATDEVVWVF
ncbi:N-acetylmuramoyl-L-alanine amidase family protein [Virgibacillus sediminis]|uniref:N-acetylmuramoyl-L-alanine amidase n=1 Tax=Virgibacillus sediminis TaxID=202260 RepID=A0ABV7A825_9BACI